MFFLRKKIPTRFLPEKSPPPAASGRCSSAFDPRGPAPLRSCAASCRPHRPARPLGVASAPEQLEPRIKGGRSVGDLYGIFIWDSYGFMGIYAETVKSWVLHGLTIKTLGNSVLAS